MKGYFLQRCCKLKAQFSQEDIIVLDTETTFFIFCVGCDISAASYEGYLFESDNPRWWISIAFCYKLWATCISQDFDIVSSKPLVAPLWLMDQRSSSHQVWGHKKMTSDPGWALSRLMKKMFFLFFCFCFCFFRNFLFCYCLPWFFCTAKERTANLKLFLNHRFYSIQNSENFVEIIIQDHFAITLWSEA